MSLRLARQQPCAMLSAVGVGMMELVETWLVTARPLQSTGEMGLPPKKPQGAAVTGPPHTQGHVHTHTLQRWQE